MTRLSRTTTIGLCGVLSVPGIAVFASLPPFVSFGAAVASAFCWCYWLERHVTPK